MDISFPEPLLEKVPQQKIIAVVVIDDAEAPAPLARALLEGGISAIELTLRTPSALESLQHIREHCPDMVAGIGMVMSAGQFGQAAASGVAFVVAPGLNPNVVRAAQAAGLPFAPGIVTPSDIEAAVELGCKLLKFFPPNRAVALPGLARWQRPMPISASISFRSAGWM